MKIVGFGKIDKSGIVLYFDEPIALHNGILSDTWFISWTKLSEMMFPQYKSEEGKILH